MPTLTPEQRRKWPPKTTGGGTPRGKKLCRCCAEDKPFSAFSGAKAHYCKSCEEWYENHEMRLRQKIDHSKYRRKEFIYNAF